MRLFLTLLLTSFIATANADITIEKFELLKTHDGKLQKCEKKADYYKPATYKFVTVYTGQPVVAGKVSMFSVFMGQYCHEYKAPHTRTGYDYIWLSRNLFESYNYPVYIDGRDEYVTVDTKDHIVVITDRSHKVIKEYKVSADPAGAISESLEFDLEAGILPENIASFNAGESVVSALFVYVRQHETRTNSWDGKVTRYINAGPAYSAVFTIKK